MVAPRQVKILINESIGRQPERRFGALAKVIGKTPIPFLRKDVIPAAKALSANVLEFVEPEIADGFSCRKNCKTNAKNVGKQTL